MHQYSSPIITPFNMYTREKGGFLDISTGTLKQRRDGSTNQRSLFSRWFSEMNSDSVKWIRCLFYWLTILSTLKLTYKKSVATASKYAHSFRMCWHYDEGRPVTFSIFSSQVHYITRSRLLWLNLLPRDIQLDYLLYARKSLSLGNAA